MELNICYQIGRAVQVTKVKFTNVPRLGDVIVLNGVGALSVQSIVHLPETDAETTISVIPFVFCEMDNNQSIAEDWKGLIQ